MSSQQGATNTAAPNKSNTSASSSLDRPSDTAESEATTSGTTNQPIKTIADVLREAAAESSLFKPRRRGRPSIGPATETEANDETTQSPARKNTAVKAKDEFCITVKGTVPVGKSVIIRIE